MCWEVGKVRLDLSHLRSCSHGRSKIARSVTMTTLKESRSGWFVSGSETIGTKHGLRCLGSLHPRCSICAKETVMSEVIYFEDLTDYSRNIAPFVLKGVKNIGWLNLQSKFPIGVFPASTFQKLKEITCGSGPFQPIVEPARELPSCEICGELKIRDHAGWFLPDGELWIPAHDIIYAAPIQILHFIEVHKYCPPIEYIEAIDALDPSLPFNGDAIFRQKLGESDWFRRAR